MPGPAQSELKSEVRQVLETLGKVLSGKAGDARCCVIRCTDKDVVESLLTVVPQAYQRILWQAQPMSDTHVATELRNVIASAQSGSRVIPILHSWPGESSDGAISADAAKGIDEVEEELGLRAYPVVLVVLAPSIRTLVNHARLFWKNKGGYVAWPNLKQAASAVGPKGRGDEEVPSGEVSEVLARLQGEKAGAFLLKAAEREMKRNNREKAREFLMGAVQVYSQVANLAGMAKVYHLLGVNCVAEGDLITATEWFAQAVDNWSIVGDQDGLSDSYLQKGQAHFARGEVDKAAEAFRLGLALDEARGDTKRVAAGKRHIAMVLERIGRFKKAEDLYRASLEMEIAQENRLGEARVLHHLGRLLDQQKQYGKAEEHYRQSIEIKESIGDKPGLATSYHEMGNMKLAQGEAAEALELYKKAVLFEEMIGDMPGLAKTLAQVGLAELKLSKFEDALRSLAKAHHLSRKTRSPLAAEIVQKVRDLEDVLSVDTYNKILREVTESLQGR